MVAFSHLLSWPRAQLQQLLLMRLGPTTPENLHLYLYQKICMYTCGHARELTELWRRLRAEMTGNDVIMNIN